jgi:hypothetical protein
MKKLLIMVSIAASMVVGVVTLHAEGTTAPEPPDAPEAPQKAFLGVVSSSLSKSTAVQLGIVPGLGLSIKSVVKGSSADRFGIEKYDILLKMDEQWLTNVSQFTTLLSLKKPGDKTEFTILRKGAEMTLEVELGAKSKKGDVSFNFETKMEAFGDRMGELAEKHEFMRYLNEPEYLEGTIRTALDKARYHIETIGDNNRSETSIIHTGAVRTIVSSEDDGILIVDRKEDGKSKVIAINTEDEMLFSGLVNEAGDELSDLEPWVKERYLNLKRNMITISVDENIDEISDDEIDDEEDDTWTEPDSK